MIHLLTHGFIFLNRTTVKDWWIQDKTKMPVFLVPWKIWGISMGSYLNLPEPQCSSLCSGQVSSSACLSQLQRYSGRYHCAFAILQPINKKANLQNAAIKRCKTIIATKISPPWHAKTMVNSNKIKHLYDNDPLSYTLKKNWHGSRDDDISILLISSLVSWFARGYMQDIMLFLSLLRTAPWIIRDVNWRAHGSIFDLSYTKF